MRRANIQLGISTHTQDNYARREPPECAERVKTLYRELGLEQLYRDYEKSSYEKLAGMVDKVATEAGLPRELFLEFADRIYKRNA